MDSDLCLLHEANGRTVIKAGANELSMWRARARPQTRPQYYTTLRYSSLGQLIMNCVNGCTALASTSIH